MAFPHDGKKFEPGQSGNPAGKPKGARHLSTVIQELMDDDNFELKLKDGKILKGKPSRKLTEVMYGLAVSGNTKAAEWLAKHGYGVKQVHANDTENPLLTNDVPKEVIENFKQFMNQSTKQ